MIYLQPSVVKALRFQVPFFHPIPMNRPQPVHSTTSSSISRPTIPVVYGLFLASLLTPLIYSEATFFGFISERTWYFSAVVEAMVLTTLFTTNFFPAKLSTLQTAVLLFLIVIFVADGWGVDPIQSYFSGYARMEGFLLYLHLGLYFFVLTRLSLSKNQWNLALLISATMAVFVVLKGYFSVAGHQAVDHRLISTVGNPSFLASYLLLHVFVAGYLFTQFTTISRLARGLLTGLAVFILISGVYLTGTRSAILGLAAGGIFLVVFLAWYRYRTISKIALWITALLAGLALTFWLVSQIAWLQKLPILYRLTHYSGVNNTFYPRYVCWKIALSGLAERPLLGWGQENFGYGFARHYDPDILLSGNAEWYDRAHNVPIDWAFSAGLIGLLAYLFIWFSLAQRLRARSVLLTSLEKGLLATLFVAYFFFNLLNFDNLLPLQLFFLLLAFIDTVPSESPVPSQPQPWLWPARLAMGAIVLLLANYAVYEPYQTLRQLDKQEQIGNVQERLQSLENIYRQVTGRKLDLADVMESLTLSVLQSDAPLVTKTACYQKTVSVMDEQMAEHPDFTRLMARVGSLYLAGGDLDKTIAICQKINAIEGAKRPTALLQLGNAYLYKSAFPQAMSSFDQAFRLQPRWQDPLLYKALAFAIQKDTAQCYQLLRQINTPTLVNKLLFVKQIYRQSGYPHEFLNRIEQTPDQAQFTPQVFVEWALAAFDSNDKSQMTSALNSFYNHYLHKRFTYSEVKEVIEEGKRGIRPDKLVTMTNELLQ